MKWGVSALLERIKKEAKENIGSKQQQGDNDSAG